MLTSPAKMTVMKLNVFLKHKVCPFFLQYELVLRPGTLDLLQFGCSVVRVAVRAENQVSVGKKP